MPKILKDFCQSFHFLLTTLNRGFAKGWFPKGWFCWEVLNGVGVDGVGGIFPFFSFFFVFLRLFVFFCVFLRFSSFFFAFLRFSSFFAYSPGTKANDFNLLGKWGISLRPRLHRPRSELPDFGGGSPAPRTGTRVHSDVPRYQKRNEGHADVAGAKKNRARSPKPPQIS